VVRQVKQGQAALSSGNTRQFQNRTFWNTLFLGLTAQREAA
jgi:hypothetical protein